MKKFAALFIAFMLVTVVGAAVAQDSSAEPNFGTYNLEAGFLPDPFIVSVISGGDIDASTLNLGNQCLGYVTENPDVIFNWSGDSQGMRIFFVGDQDATLIVQMPDGSFLCNDDSVGLDPAVEIVPPAEGEYWVWVGSYSQGEENAAFGYLMLTELPNSLPGNILSPIINFVTSYITMEEMMGE